MKITLALISVLCLAVLVICIAVQCKYKDNYKIFINAGWCGITMMVIIFACCMGVLVFR